MLENKREPFFTVNPVRLSVNTAKHSSVHYYVIDYRVRVKIGPLSAAVAASVFVRNNWEI